jgi:hypothetical protein
MEALVQGDDSDIQHSPARSGIELAGPIAKGGPVDGHRN